VLGGADVKVWIVFRDSDVDSVHATRESALEAAQDLMVPPEDWEEYPGTEGAVTWEGPRSIGLEGHEVQE
jgi:hypothetical protein